MDAFKNKLSKSLVIVADSLKYYLHSNYFSTSMCALKMYLIHIK